ncbi:outer membrane beta-barrel family protein [Sediminibacterium soli]|uniref:outer membrane beta-barrel family protein n=1 Tax=Sediminibacterium soli TaxID=2698829 RepID=UPI00137AE8F6|nr:outer membrane beta-barrel family protein [Sediminibacterium soli]NCI46482.1 outer membrane beta-barrel protein [Sediminibacterium soli]
MRKLYVLLGVMLLLCIATQAQSVKGTVTDTAGKIPLHHAVIYLKNAKDSALVAFTRADKQGVFELHGAKPGTYTMVVTYPGYVDWIDSVTVQQHPLQVAVALITKAHLLQEVIVRQTIPPIRIKGDTTEYLADSFKVKPGATVEELLRVMPGFSIDSKGKITTQGQKVQKVLVDGDEFFGADPTMATQNLNAKDVARVQVYDKKSDQATLTGIDDGSKEKTVNLILKEDAKKGYFGRVDAGTDFDKYYQSKISANRFTSSLKAGALVVADRTGRNGMNWEEMQDYGEISTTVENGDVGFSWEGDNDFDTWGKEGIPENLQGAVMLNKKYGTRKSSTANNYSYNRLNMAGNGNTATKYILHDAVNYNNQRRSNTSMKWKQAGSTKNEIIIDSMTSVNINARGSFGKSSSYGTQDAEYLAGDFTPINTSRRINSSTGDNSMRKADVFLKRKLNKTGTRSVTFSGGLSGSHNSTEGLLFNQTSYYTGGVISAQQVTDQRKTNVNEAKTAQGLVSYTEPLSKRLSVNLNYTYNWGNTEQDTRSYEKRNGKYDSLNLLYSNHYRFINSSHRAGMMFNYSSKKITARAGLAIQDLSLKQTNLYKDSSFARDFTNFFPTANIRWKFSGSGNLNLSYSGYTQQPSLSALQPILNNNDPLNIQQGNPGLRPAFTHSLYFNASNYKTLQNKGMWMYGSISFTENAFSNKSTIDAQGRRIMQTVNVNGNYRYNLSVDFSKQIKLFKLETGFAPNISGSRNKNFVNGQENITNSIHGGAYVYIRRYIEKKMSFDISGSAQYNHSRSSINQGATTRYWTFNQNIWFDYKFRKGWNVSTNYDFNYRQKLTANDRANNMFIWNASVEKKLFKKSDITAIFTVNDILNDRQGFNRDISSNYITENTYTTVQRYIMLSVRWKFAKNRKTESNEE